MEEKWLKKKVEELLEKMTLEEKIAQLGSIPSGKLVENGRFSREKAQELLKNGIGQITRVAGYAEREPEESVEIINEIQKFLKEETRLGIPAIIHEECLSGVMTKGATTFPQAIGMASTFEP
ncbi:MAG TPA: glycoside hydrolase family 3 N-terminal domain-containing protein, partial [bacterium]|nr:glycoside hydrolase family 3 N-terminal domain-containing protein [bacterium]